MLGQQFALSDVPTVITLIFLEGLLSADNALVLAILVQGLPKPLQRKGLLYGLVGAFVLRGIAILVASTLMRYWWIEAGGAAYLLYLAVHHFVGKASHSRLADKKPRSFWPTIVIVELTDLAFAIDSILAAVGLVGPAPHREAVHPKLWVIYLGGIIGVVMMRFVAGFFLTLLERFERLETAAYLIIAWIAVKLGIAAYAHFTEIVLHGTPAIEHIPAPIFWSVMIVLFASGFLPKKEVTTPSEEEGD